MGSIIVTIFTLRVKNILNKMSSVVIKSNFIKQMFQKKIITAVAKITKHHTRVVSFPVSFHFCKIDGDTT